MFITLNVVELNISLHLWR